MLTRFLQVQLLKHTVSQIYDKADWKDAICVVNAKDRGAKVGMALEFDEYELAFMTFDLLIQVCVFFLSLFLQ